MSLLVAVALSGCAGDNAADLPALGGPPGGPAGFRFPQDDSPIVAGDPVGIDLHVWATPDDDGSVDRTLAALGVDATRDDEAAWGSDAWRASGVAFAELPGEALADLRRRLPEAVISERSFLRAATRWEEVYRGAPIDERLGVIVAGETTPTGVGTPRLLGRAWYGPANVRGRVLGAVRLQLAVQLDENRAPERFLLEAPTELPRLGDAGPSIADLVLTGELVPGNLYLMTADAPAAPPPEEAADRAGPVAPATPTLGQALFTGVTAEQAGTRYRVMLAIVPRGPGRFSLIN